MNSYCLHEIVLLINRCNMICGYWSEGGLRALTHHRVVMYVSGNLSEGFASYSFERRDVS